MGPVAQWTLSLHESLVRLYKRDHFEHVPQRIQFGVIPEVAKVDVDLRRTIERQEKALYFSTLDAMCTKQGCLTYVGSNPMDIVVWDHAHLTTPGAEYLAEKVTSVISASRPQRH
jgi:hypothetical protein